MAKKPPTVVIVDQGRRGPGLTRGEALTIVAETAAQREQRRKGRTLYRLRRHLYPWWAAVGLMVAAALSWLVSWLGDEQTATMVAGSAAIVTGFVGWMISRRAGRWRRRVLVGSGVAAAWLAYAAQTGPSWRAPLALFVAVVAVSARWWQSVRIPHPQAPAPPEPPKEEGPTEQLWHDNVADKGGVLPGSYLTDKDTSRPNAEVHTVHLKPGKQTITQLLGSLEKVAGGLLVPIKQVVLEPHPDENPNHGRLTVVRRSPIEQTVPYAGARFGGSRRHIIEIGPYGDGEGFAPWRMWEPGEKPMTGSWLSGFVVGGTGIGKSRLMELLAAGYMASGYAVVWFADPQGGASSPALQEFADWYVDGSGVPKMLAALEAIAKARELENSVEGWTRFDPSPERPGIVVFLDECHDTFGRHGKRWADLSRKCQKVGIALVGLTQYAALESLGGQEPLRAALLTNAIVMRTESRQQGQLIPGIEVNPLTLPAIPGFGYVLKRGAHGRTAPFRSEYLAEPEAWLARYPMPPLDELSAVAAGDGYRLRRDQAAELQEKNRRRVEELRGGSRPRLVEPLDDEDESDAGSGSVPGVPTFPAAPTLHVVPAPETPEAAAESGEQQFGRERILDSLSRGPASPSTLRQLTGLGETRVRQLLKELIDAGQVEQVKRGVYRRADSA